MALLDLDSSTREDCGSPFLCSPHYPDSHSIFTPIFTSSSVLGRPHFVPPLPPPEVPVTIISCRKTKNKNTRPHTKLHLLSSSYNPKLSGAITESPIVEQPVAHNPIPIVLENITGYTITTPSNQLTSWFSPSPPPVPTTHNHWLKSNPTPPVVSRSISSSVVPTVERRFLRRNFNSRMRNTRSREINVPTHLNMHPLTSNDQRLENVCWSIFNVIIRNILYIGIHTIRTNSKTNFWKS